VSYWTEIFFFSMSSAALLLSIAGLWFTAVMPGIGRFSKRFFSCYYLVFLLGCITGFAELVSYHLPVSRGALYGIILLESLLLFIPLPMLTVFLLHYCGEDIRSSRLFHAVLGLMALYVIFLLSSLFHGSFFYITPDKLFLRGPLYPLFPLSMLAILLINLAGTLKRRAQISRRVFLAFLITVLPLTGAMCVQIFVDFFPLIDISYVLSALAMYSLILSDQIEQDRRYQQEIAHERASVMVLRMRPHFIYNTLMTIHSLCRTDPGKARQVTIDFTNYLRRNFNAVASDSTVPFKTELEHTMAYLAVEKAQYDDLLSVEYDTPHTGFRLPPLTLQPLVENAVKHGMDPNAGTLCILVRTRQTNSGTEILVQDNGCGFDPSDESRPKPTLTNIQQRLSLMCGGHLAIVSGKGGGTSVTITIPDSAGS